jgi:sugar phosphate isomerase/epimerase
VRDHADRLGIRLEAGMRSICPSSSMFDAKEGTASEQIARMLGVTKLLGSPIVRCFLGRGEDRPIERQIENTVKVLRGVRSQVADSGIRLAIENHAGDMQGRELRTLIEEAGPDFVGAVIDSGNPLWTLEDPHDTLEALAPHALTSHVRDSRVWKTPEGIAVAWTRMGEGNVNIDRWVKRYGELCPGKALSLEIIVIPPRTYKVWEPAFWDRYRNVPAWSFARFAALAEKGEPVRFTAPAKDQAGAREKEDLLASAAYVKRLLA